VNPPALQLRICPDRAVRHRLIFAQFNCDAWNLT